MKKLLLAFLTAGLLTTFTGCASDESTTRTTTSSSSTVTANPGMNNNANVPPRQY